MNFILETLLYFRKWKASVFVSFHSFSPGITPKSDQVFHLQDLRVVL